MKTYQRNSQGRMFESDFLEAASKVHPITPLLIFAPVVLASLAYAWTHHLASLLTLAASFAMGWVVWCFMEYTLHRYFFHWEGSGPITRRIHDIAHGYHHDFPDDAMRLVMPIGASIPLAIVIYGGLSLLGRPGVTLPLFAGIVFGYLVYDYTHWATHAVTPRTAWGKALRSHHMAHHFASPDKNFGISHRWVDSLLGTRKVREQRPGQ